MIRGKGSVKEGKVGRKDGQMLPGEDEPLHALVTANTMENVKKAVEQVRFLSVVGVLSEPKSFPGYLGDIAPPVCPGFCSGSYPRSPERIWKRKLLLSDPEFLTVYLVMYKCAKISD